jgi:hypothetical protein
MLGKTIVFWLGVLTWGYWAWHIFSGRHPAAVPHGILGWGLLLGCEVLAFIVFKVCLHFTYWLLAEA